MCLIRQWEQERGAGGQVDTVADLGLAVTQS